MFCCFCCFIFSFLDFFALTQALLEWKQDRVKIWKGTSSQSSKDAPTPAAVKNLHTHKSVRDQFRGNCLHRLLLSFKYRHSHFSIQPLRCTLDRTRNVERGKFWTTLERELSNSFLYLLHFAKKMAIFEQPLSLDIEWWILDLVVQFTLVWSGLVWSGLVKAWMI